MGVMKDSRHVTDPRPVFGSATRDQVAKVWLDEELMKVNFGKQSPGPCQYSKPSGMGKQAESMFPTQPAYKQSSSPRFSDKDPRRDVPGAGSYQSAYASLGKQALSNKQTLPSPKIGTSNRDAVSKVRLLHGHGM